MERIKNHQGNSVIIQLKNKKEFIELIPKLNKVFNDWNKDNWDTDEAKKKKHGIDIDSESLADEQDFENSNYTIMQASEFLGEDPQDEIIGKLEEHSGNQVLIKVYTKEQWCKLYPLLEEGTGNSWSESEWDDNITDTKESYLVADLCDSYLRTMEQIDEPDDWEILEVSEFITSEPTIYQIF